MYIIIPGPVDIYQLLLVGVYIIKIIHVAKRHSQIRCASSTLSIKLSTISVLIRPEMELQLIKRDPSMYAPLIITNFISIE